MNAVISREPQEDLELGNQGLASVTFTLQWFDGRAVHEDEVHMEKFSVWRDADLLPAEIGVNMPGMRAGDGAQAALAAGEIASAWNPDQAFTAKPSGFDRCYRRGLTVEPHCGRFYPQGFFHDCQGIVREALQPARITGLDEQYMQVDLNHPFARFEAQVECRVDAVLPGSDMRGGRCVSPLDDLVRYPGLAAPLADGSETDFGEDGNGMSRMDERDDEAFYQQSRLVQHLDTRALTTVNALYRRLLPEQGDVLDLMASYDSHLEGCLSRSLHLIGMNADELNANQAATKRHVLNLNQPGTLPLEDACRDAVVCTASVEYLLQPRAVFADVLRVLRPGGVFVITFSNRWFPTKAIQLWSELHEFERVGLVTQWLQQTGFENLHTFSSRGWPRPSDDPHCGETAESDPVYAVWGFKPAV